MLRAAGIDVTENVMQSEATRANAGFLKRVTQGLPFVTLKLATTLDGRIATATGESRWITGPAARRAVHAMRLNHDAVLIGSGTARADDPDLTVRELGASHQPIRIVMDTHLSHNPDSRLGQTAQQSPVWLLHGPDADPQARAVWSGQGAALLEIPCENGTIDPRAAMKTLAAQGLTRIFCEGGGSLAASLIRANLIDDLALFTAGALIGADGQASLAPLRTTMMAQPFLGGDAPDYADYCVFGGFMWARSVSAFALLSSDDPVHAWRERMLDLHGGMARAAPRPE